MNKKTREIAKDFTPFPAGRYEKDGPYTGEGFRKRILVPALKQYDSVEIILDGTIGYGSSFLEETFGGLIREEGFSYEEINNKLILISKRKSILKSIENYIYNSSLEKK